MPRKISVYALRLSAQAAGWVVLRICPCRTIERPHAAGVETVEVPYSEIRKNGGGIHCSTLPLLREES